MKAFPKLPRSPLALAIMNLLLECPRHPYEIKTLMKHRGHNEVIKLKGASIYDTVERLERGGFIESQETSREGRRPERTVYALTESGRDELQTWMHEIVSEPAREFPEFAAALAFIACLDRDEALQLLRRRAVLLEAELAAAQTKLQGTTDAGIPRLFMLESEYLIAVRRAEVDWVRKVAADTERGEVWITHAEMQVVADAFHKRLGTDS